MPGPKCYVEFCNNNSYKSKLDGTNLGFHRFPKDKGLRNLWISKCGSERFFKSEFAFVCSEHFTSDDYIRDMQAELLGYVGRRKLYPHAVPSLNLPYETSENISPEEKAVEDKKKHEKLIEDCLNETGDSKAVLSFETFKKLRYKKEKKIKPGIYSKLARNSVYLLNVPPKNSEQNVYDISIPKEELTNSSRTHRNYVEDNNAERYENEDLAKETKENSISMDDLSRMKDSPIVEVDRTSDDPAYLKDRIKELEEHVQQQKELICRLKRGIIREKKMTEKIILASNAGLPLKRKKRNKYDLEARNAILDIYSLSPECYSRISKALNLPKQSVLARWEPELTSPQHEVAHEVCIEQNESNVEIVPEDEYIVEEVEA